MPLMVHGIPTAITTAGKMLPDASRISTAVATNGIDLMNEYILIRGQPRLAELVYISARGDYRVYLYRGKRYVVKTESG